MALFKSWKQTKIKKCKFLENEKKKSNWKYIFSENAGKREKYTIKKKKLPKKTKKKKLVFENLKKNHKTVKKRKNKNEKERSISENPKKTQIWKWLFSKSKKKKQTPKLKTPFFEKQKKKSLRNYHWSRRQRSNMENRNGKINFLLPIPLPPPHMTAFLNKAHPTSTSWLNGPQSKPVSTIDPSRRGRGGAISVYKCFGWFWAGAARFVRV